MSLQGRSPNHDDDDEVGEYDYNNPNDTSNFCPAVQVIVKNKKRALC